jgi:hypothetical protein
MVISRHPLVVSRGTGLTGYTELSQRHHSLLIPDAVAWGTGLDGIGDKARCQMSVMLFDHPRIGVPKVLRVAKHQFMPTAARTMVPEKGGALVRQYDVAGLAALALPEAAVNDAESPSGRAKPAKPGTRRFVNGDTNRTLGPIQICRPLMQHGFLPFRGPVQEPYKGTSQSRQDFIAGRITVRKNSEPPVHRSARVCQWVLVSARWSFCSASHFCSGTTSPM